MSKRPPLLSVVMPARNALPFLDAAIQSILTQTLADFEFVIRDDGSTDGTSERLRYWAARDTRIRLHAGACLGPAGSSNWLVRAAGAAIVARMDADDIARPDRLETQLRFFLHNPSLVLLGSIADTIDGAGRQVRKPDFWRLKRRSCFLPFPHTSIMFRRSGFNRAGGYREAADYWEDLDLCLRMAKQGKVGVVAEPLVSHRVSASSVRLGPDQDCVEEAVDRMYRALKLFQRGRSYEALLADVGREASPARVAPMALLSIYSTRLWAGLPVRVLGRLLRRARLTADLDTLVAIVWAAIASLHSPLLRSILRMIIYARNWAVRSHIRVGFLYEWQPARGRARD